MADWIYKEQNAWHKGRLVGLAVVMIPWGGDINLSRHTRTVTGGQRLVTLCKLTISNKLALASNGHLSTQKRMEGGKQK